MNSVMFCLVIVSLFSQSTLIRASVGDRSHLYRRCVETCTVKGCVEIDVGNSRLGVNACQAVQACPGLTGRPVPGFLYAAGWSCEDDCRYHCMWKQEKYLEDLGRKKPIKYHGKWPFVRILGTQEIASVLFSLGNLLAQLHNMRKLTSTFNDQKADHSKYVYPYRMTWWMYAWGHVNSWVWSAIFHIRDTHLTERLDYLSAAGNIFMGMFVTIIRTQEIQRRIPSAFTGVTVGGLFLHHIYYMLFIAFDYGRNMKICVGLGVIQGILWSHWSWKKRHPARKTLWTFLALVYCAMGLELFDFPPLYGLLDAHALWHATTIPLTYLWYQFVIQDVDWMLSTHSKI